MFNRSNFLRCLVVAIAACACTNVMGAQAPNPRGSSAVPSSPRTSDSVNVSRSAARSVQPVMSRSSSRGAVVSNAARGGATVARTTSNIATVRGANARNATSARSAKTSGASRAGVARATAVFNDISKIGGGYASCRESYATCMDQICANANDTYRRCFCSSRYNEFRNTESALDEARGLLAKFEDNNLNAVDKTAAEVTAMYSASVGEAAIKNDTSAAAKLLDEIGDLLSGKKKSTYTNSSSTSLGILSFDISDNVDDIWSDGGNSIFGGNGQNLSELEGVDLYNAANKQCMALIGDLCENKTVTDMARSSYSIMITQDCNAYQKNIDKKVESIKQTVRTAEKYLRQARLENYRAHNSADVNECISRVRTALTADTACGANYKRCLDYTGAYISQTTGEPIYSPRLFKLTELINLSGSENSDVLKDNKKFDDFLESRKIFATSALDTCRDISNVVWNEFKRTALIEIAQAQDEKIEEVKMSCVSTMADCYDTQSSALKDFDKTTAQMVGALSAYAAKQMCIDKVSACAALYNDTPCDFDSKSGLNNAACGLSALVNFVDAVDDVRIAEGCETSLKNYAQQLCSDNTTGRGYPWNCRLMDITQVKANITKMSDTYCSTDVVRNGGTYKNVSTMISNLIDEIRMDIADSLATECEERNGVWKDTKDTADKYNAVFYRSIYGTANPPERDGVAITGYGVCIENTIKTQCEIADVRTGGNGYAKYDPLTDKCIFTKEYYKYECDVVNGMWENDHCYLYKD